MNTVLEIIGVSAVVLIAGIVTYQFVQEQQALNQLSKSLNSNPESETELASYGSYQDCVEWWQNPDNVKIRENYSLTIDDMCNEYR